MDILELSFIASRLVSLEAPPMILETLTKKLTSNTPVILSPDSREVLLRQIANTSLLVKMLHEAVSQGNLEEGFTATGLGHLEQLLCDLSKHTGVASQAADEIAQRHAALRSANERVRELEAQIGTASSQMDLRLAIQRYSKILHDWWQVFGFGYVSDLTFTDAGTLQATLSGRLSPPGCIASMTPASDKEEADRWIQCLKDRGFDLYCEHQEYSVLDTPANRQVLDSLLSAIPSVVVTNVTSYRGKNAQFTLRSIEIVIRKPADLLELELATEHSC